MTDTLSSQTDKPEFASVNDALEYVQRNLKAPKSNTNEFGKYKYRSCEDILEAAKKVMPVGCQIIINDEVILVGDRYYIRAIVDFFYYNQSIRARAAAREPAEKRGMDESQITGAASSYARKYALNGLLLIDDTKDADTMAPPEPKYSREDKITQVDLIDSIANITTPEGIDKWHQHYAETINQLPAEFQKTIEAQLDNRLAQLENGVEPPQRFYRHVDVEHAKDYFQRFMTALPKMVEGQIISRQSTDEAKIKSLEEMLKAKVHQVDGKSPVERLRKAMNDRVLELRGEKNV